MCSAVVEGSSSVNVANIGKFLIVNFDGVTILLSARRTYLTWECVEGGEEQEEEEDDGGSTHYKTNLNKQKRSTVSLGIDPTV